MSSVRVMWTHPCPNGCPSGDDAWSLRTKLGDDPPCDLCMGFGTITEPVACAGCRYWYALTAFDNDGGHCAQWDGMDTGASFACVAWSPRHESGEPRA